MKKVTKKTRAKKDGTLISCPECEQHLIVHHFSWSAVQCQNCKNMIDKEDWNIPDKPIETSCPQCNSEEDTIRVKLIDTIVEFSKDELDFEDAIIIAKETNEQLLDRLTNILHWYFENYNDTDTLINNSKK